MHDNYYLPQGWNHTIYGILLIPGLPPRPFSGHTLTTRALAVVGLAAAEANNNRLWTHQQRLLSKKPTWSGAPPTSWYLVRRTLDPRATITSTVRHTTPGWRPRGPTPHAAIIFRWKNSSMVLLTDLKWLYIYSCYIFCQWNNFSVWYRLLGIHIC